MSRIEEALLIDLEFGVSSSSSGDVERVSGMANIKQALFNRLMTVKGSLAHRPNYGVGVQNWLGGISSIERQRTLAEEIKSQFEQDPRVSSVESVKITPSIEDARVFIVSYRVNINGFGAFSDEVDPFGGT
jgi:phage baseplate assembly protein W